MACERLAVGEGCFGGRVDKGPGVKARRLGLPVPVFHTSIFSAFSLVFLQSSYPSELRLTSLRDAAQWANCPWFATRPRLDKPSTRNTAAVRLSPLGESCMKCIRRSLWRTTPWIVVSTAAFGLALSAHSAPPAETPAAPPAAPKVSTFAPAADLAAQADGYLAAITDAVDNLGNFVDSKEQLAKDSNTLIVIALALGLSDQPNKYQAGARPSWRPRRRLPPWPRRPSRRQPAAPRRLIP